MSTPSIIDQKVARHKHTTSQIKYCNSDTCEEYGTSVRLFTTTSDLSYGLHTDTSCSDESTATTLSTTSTSHRISETTLTVLSAITPSPTECTSADGCNDIHSGESSSMKIGIGIGVGVGGLLLIVFLFFAHLKRRQRRMEMQLVLATHGDFVKPQEAKGNLIHEMSSESQLTELEGERD